MRASRRYARYIRALEQGKFHKILRDPKPLWLWLERQASIPHTELVALSLPQASGSWTLWACYRVVKTQPIEVRLESLCIPDPEHGDPHKLPDGFEGMPIYEA